MATSVIEIEKLMGGQGTMILDFNDMTFFSNLYEAPNTCRFIPFKTATANQPRSAAWGVCFLYYGGQSNTFIQVAYYAAGEFFLRHCNNGTRSSWYRYVGSAV